MKGKPFFDTTVLVYAVTQDESRTGTAEKLLEAGGHISVQVLNEFTAVARRKLKLSWIEIEERLTLLRFLCEPVLPLRVETHERGIQIAALSGYHIYDALIVAAALEAGCTVLYSEDMQHGREFEGMVIVNPFAENKPE